MAAGLSSTLVVRDLAAGLELGRALRVGCAAMSTPQDSPKRYKQKQRRTKQLEQWRAKKAAEQAKAAPQK